MIRGALTGGVIVGTAGAYGISDIHTDNAIINLPMTFSFTGFGMIIGLLYPISLPMATLAGVNYVCVYGIRKYMLKDKSDERV